MVRCWPLLIFLAFHGSVWAESTIKQSTLDGTQETHSRVDQSKVWGVGRDDWSRYEKIMENEGQYFWKNLDPITVLGLNARSDSERIRFAELLARQEFRNTQKTILLDRAYHKAFLRLYGQLPIIDTSGLSLSRARASLLSIPESKVSGEFGDRYIIFVNTRCSQCDAQVKKLLGSLELGVLLDIHFKDDSRQAITAWASRLNISADAVEMGTITLNPQSALYEKFGDPAQPSVYFFDKTSNQVRTVE